jgi:hypothetical protein
VWVKNPEKVERSLGVGSYVSYLVRTECSSGTFADTKTAAAAAAAAAVSSPAAQHSVAPAADGSASRSSGPESDVHEVRRRFSDFEQLHK